MQQMGLISQTPPLLKRGEPVEKIANKKALKGKTANVVALA